MENETLDGGRLPEMLLDLMLEIHGSQVAIAHQLAALTSLMHLQAGSATSTQEVLAALAERASAAKGQMAYELFAEYGNVPPAIGALLDKMTGGDGDPDS